MLHFQNSKSSNRCRSVYGTDIKRDLSKLFDTDHPILKSYMYIDASNYQDIRIGGRLVIMNLNIHSILAKIDDLNSLLDLNLDIKPDIILLCETFLSKINKDRYAILGYTQYHKTRTNHKGGCVSIYVSSTLQPINQGGSK